MNKYNYHDNFDLLTMRHEFVKNSSYIKESDIEKFSNVSDITASIMYSKLRPNFDKVGFDIDDIQSLSKMYLVGYLAKYGFTYHTEQLDRFVRKFKKTKKRQPTQNEIDAAERNEVINFIRQKLQHCSVVCARKARNITVGREIRKYYAKTADSQDVNEDLILEDYKKYGYRLVTVAEYKGAVKLAKKNGDVKLVDGDGFEILTIHRHNNGISDVDYLQILLNNESIMNTNPEDYLIKLEKEYECEAKINNFINMQQSEKITLLEGFINQNKNNSNLKTEVVSARKLLRKYDFWYGN